MLEKNTLKSNNHQTKKQKNGQNRKNQKKIKSKNTEYPYLTPESENNTISIQYFHRNSKSINDIILKFLPIR